jgi:hypothetical protein
MEHHDAVRARRLPQALAVDIGDAIGKRHRMIERKVFAQRLWALQHIGRAIAGGDAKRQVHQCPIAGKVARKEGCRQAIGNLVESLDGHVRSFL